MQNADERQSRWGTLPFDCVCSLHNLGLAKTEEDEFKTMFSFHENS